MPDLVGGQLAGEGLALPPAVEAAVADIVIVVHGADVVAGVAAAVPPGVVDGVDARIRPECVPVGRLGVLPGLADVPRQPPDVAAADVRVQVDRAVIVAVVQLQQLTVIEPVLLPAGRRVRRSRSLQLYVFHRFSVTDGRHRALPACDRRGQRSDSGTWTYYRQYVILAIAISGIFLSVVAALTWTVRLLRISTLDAQALADKLAFPEPASALEWPELRVQSVVPQPDDLSPVIVQVGWPAHPEQVATLLMALDPQDARALSLLCQWSSAGAAVVTLRQGPELELRRRQSLERIHATLLDEGNPAR
jgi:hypothetical protein